MLEYADETSSHFLAQKRTKKTIDVCTWLTRVELPQGIRHTISERNRLTVLGAVTNSSQIRTRPQRCPVGLPQQSVGTHTKIQQNTSRQLHSERKE